MKYGNILLFAIPSTLNTGHFVEYFIKNSENLYLFLMPLSHQPPKITLQHYSKGKLSDEKVFFFYKGKSPFLRYFFFYAYYLCVIFFVLPRKSIVLATTPQYCIFSSVFRIIKKVEIVYHVGDYYPNEKGIMAIYQFLIHYYNSRLPYVVYCSPVLEKLLHTGKEKVNGNRDYWVFGVDNKKIKRKPRRNRLGYIGVLRDGQGIPIIFDALMENPQLTLEIIGEGPLLPHLKKEVERLQLSPRVKFWGLLQVENKITSVASKWQIGLAPYDPSIRNMTYYGDPSKVKFYLEYRLPVIMTKITYLYKDLQNYQAGVPIDYDTQSLLNAILTIQKKYPAYQKGVDEIITKYEYNTLYDGKFRFMKYIW